MMVETGFYETGAFFFILALIERIMHEIANYTLKCQFHSGGKANREFKLLNRLCDVDTLVT